MPILRLRVRSPLRAFCTLSPLLVALVALAGPASADLVDEQWIAVETPNFLIKSRLSERRTLELAEDIELFRNVVVEVTNARRRTSPVPTRVIVLGSDAEWSEIGREDAVASFMAPGLRDNFIVMRRSDEPLETASVQRAYSHFLMRNQDGRRYPRWYDEGHAAFLSSVRLRRGRVIVGSVPDRAFPAPDSLAWIPIRRIVDPQGIEDWPAERRSMFHAQSWALVHYLMVGSEQRDRFGTRLATYVKRLAEGADVQKSFEGVFGIDLRRLDRDVKNYLDRGRFEAWELPADRFRSRFEPRVRSVSPAEIAVDLGELALRVDDAERAGARFERAASLDPARARAQSGLGRHHQNAGRLDLALVHLERAVSLAGDDPYVQLDAGRYWLDRARSDSDDRARARHLGRAREHFASAWKLDESMPETFAMYGHSFLLSPGGHERAVQMIETARSMLPSSPEIRLLLAEAFAAVDRPDAARDSARAVLAWSHGDPRRVRDARALLDQLDARAAASAAAEAPAARADAREPQ